MHRLRPFVGKFPTRSDWICHGCLEKISRRRYSANKTTPELQSHSRDYKLSRLGDENFRDGGIPSASSDIPSLLLEDELEHSSKSSDTRKPIKIAKIQPYGLRAEPKDNLVKKRLRSSIDVVDPDGSLSRSKIRFHGVDFQIRYTSSALVRYTKLEHPVGPDPKLPEKESQPRINKYSSESIATRNKFSKNKSNGLLNAGTIRSGSKDPEAQHRTQSVQRTRGLRSFSTQTRISGLSTAATRESPAHQIPHALTYLTIRERLRQYQKDLDDADAAKKAALGIVRPAYLPDIHSIRTEDSLEADDALQGDEQDTTVEDTASFLRPKITAGSLVEISLGGVPALAVITAIFDTGSGLQYQIVTSAGTWQHKVFTSRNTPTFVIRDYFKLSDLAGLKQFLPSSPMINTNRDQAQDEHDLLPPEISFPVTKKLQAFQKEADDIYRSHSTNIDNVFGLLAKQDQAVHMHLDDITRRALGIKEIPRLEANYAVHRACTQYSSGFLLSKNHWYTRSFELLSKKEVKTIEQVRIWVREHSDLAISKSNGQRLDETSILEEFAEEVRPVILESRKNRDCLVGAHLGPTKGLSDDLLTDLSASKIITGGQISSNGRLILSFVKLWAERIVESPGGMILAPSGIAIMKSIGLYGDDLMARGRGESLSLVKECGIVPPWQMHSDRGSRLSNPYQDANSQVARFFSQAGAEVEAGHYQVDTMEKLRHDWGDMPVYCIDSASTTEVDDGISLEKTSDSGIYWLHVHVANPTSFITPNSKVNALAQELGHTVYLPHRIDRMLPFEVLRERLSLHAGCPTITFSTKITMEGQILDRQIRNGRIHNVLHITPETVAQHTEESLSSVTPFNTYSVGSPIERPPLTKHVSEDLSPETISALKMMKSLGDAWAGHEASSHRKPWQVNYHPKASTQVHNLDVVDIDLSNYRRFFHDPTITYSAQPWSPYSRVPISRQMGRDLVQSMMQIANNTAAEWCSQRSIPTLFRGCVTNALKDLSAEAARPFHQSGDMSTDFEEYCRRFSAPMWDVRATLSMRKVAHELIGVDAYAWVTSPLRRYEDMVSHWQIEAALRDEAKLGRQTTDRDGSSLPFSQRMIKKQMRRTAETSMTYSWQLSQSEKYWATEFLIRGALFGQCQDLPDLFTFYITSTNQDFLQGYIAEIGSRAFVSTRNLDYVEKGPGVGQIWKAKPDREDLRMSGVGWKLMERVA